MIILDAEMVGSSTEWTRENEDANSKFTVVEGRASSVSDSKLRCRDHLPKVFVLTVVSRDDGELRCC